MAITPLDFLSFAKNLTSDTEINIRNTIGRSYYAAYHVCNNMFLSDKNIKDVGMHERLILSIKKSPNTQDRAIGFSLGQLKQLRVQADYKINDAIHESDRQTALASAENIFKKIEAIQSK